MPTDNTGLTTAASDSAELAQQAANLFLQAFGSHPERLEKQVGRLLG